MIAFVVPKISLIKVFLCGKNSLKLIYNVHDNFISFHAWAVCSSFTSKLILWTIFVIMILFWVNASVIGLNLPLYVCDVIFSK